MFQKTIVKDLQYQLSYVTLSTVTVHSDNILREQSAACNGNLMYNIFFVIFININHC